MTSPVLENPKCKAPNTNKLQNPKSKQLWDFDIGILLEFLILRLRFPKLVLTLITVSFISCNTTEHSIKIGSPLDETYAVRADDIKKVLDDGVRFLLATQNKDGSWGSFESTDISEMGTTRATHDAYLQATSALCCMAMMEARGSDSERIAALNKGLRYLMNQEPEGRATPPVLYQVWSLTYVTQCLSRAIKYEHADIPKEKLNSCAQRWVRMLETIQAADGGWCYYDFGYGLRTPSGWISTSFTTAAALAALWDAEKAGLKVDAKVKKAALARLERFQTPDNTFIYGTYLQMRPGHPGNRPKGALGRSQPCNLMLFRYGKTSVAALKLGLDRMFGEHQFMEMGQYRPIPHDSWYKTAGYYFLFGHFYASEVIAELPRSEQGYYWKALARALLQCHQPDGSWWDWPLYSYYKSYGTAFAILSLTPALEAISNIT